MICKIEFVVVFDHMVGQVAETQAELVVELRVLLTLEVLNADFPLVILPLLHFPEVSADEQVVFKSERVFPHICGAKPVVKDPFVFRQRREHVIWVKLSATVHI